VTRVLLAHSSAEDYGSDRVCFEIAIAARAAGIDLHVMVPTTGPLVDVLRSADVPVTILDPLVLRRGEFRPGRVGATVVNAPRRFGALARFAREGRFDLVHANCAVTWGGAELARRWRVPLVWHVHEFLGGGFVQRVFEQRLGRADVILTCSRSVAEQFTSESLRLRSRVAYSGARPKPARHESVPFSGSPLEIVCVGRLNGWKGQPVLVRALAELRRRGRDARVSLVGDVFSGEDRYRQHLESLAAELGVADAVTFTGFRDDAEELLAAADVAVVPSLKPEPFGLVVVEAMAHGRPTIATDAGGPAEIVTDWVDGVLVPPGDAPALAAAVCRLADDPERARAMGERARTTAARFTHEQMTAVVLDVYAALLRMPELAS
jgi:glycosyltransferase involved in cell wall biosynthesis